MPRVVREFAGDCRTLICRQNRIGQITLFGQEGFETDECQRRNGIVGKEYKS